MSNVRPQMPPSVRLATLQDAEAIAHVLCQSRSEFLAFAPMAHTPDEVLGWLANELIPAGGVSVATLDGHVVAMLAVSKSPTGGWIDQLYVKPGYTGQGIGEVLLRSAQATLGPPVRLFTFQANARARRFYERHGYVAVRYSDGSSNEERCPDVLYEWWGPDAAA